MTDRNQILGYASPLAVTAGESVSFHLSSEQMDSALLDIVRVRCGDADPAGPGLKLVAQPSELDGNHPLTYQRPAPGSYGRVANRKILDGLASFSFGCFIWPTLPTGGRQAIVSHRSVSSGEGWALEINETGVLEACISSGETTFRIALSKPLIQREWVFVAFARDAEPGSLRLAQWSLDPQAGRDVTEENIVTAGNAGLAGPAGADLIFGAEMGGEVGFEAHYNGKIDRPRLYQGAISPDLMMALCEAVEPSATDHRLIGAWDFSLEMETDAIVDRSSHRLDGRLYQQPTRAVTGANWRGDRMSWTERPSEYGAIHFHADDMIDAGWQPTASLRIPEAWPSGYYALRARSADGKTETFVSFFVSARPGTPRAKLAVIASTATYLAYANQALRHEEMHMEALFERLIVFSSDDLFLQEHPEVGLSTYDKHRDCSGCCYSSASRPILNMRPAGAPFNYGSDTLILDWLEELGEDYDVITDEDLHRHGLSLLQPYRCVISPSHPEYYSKPMLDAMEAYQRGGGRHMYLGGNGFYWRIAWHPNKRGVMEIRRDVTGVRTWEGEAGENGLSFTGEPSGLWRSRGRPPQRLVGVGFCAQIFTGGSPYRQLPDASKAECHWVFEGIGPDEEIGNFGLRGGGAAGTEVDRIEPALGSAPNIYHLATADCLGHGALLSSEEVATMHHGVSGDETSQASADITLFETANSGAVFSVGSIAWSCSLPHDSYRNNVSVLTGNVLRRFLRDEPIFN